MKHILSTISTVSMIEHSQVQEGVAISVGKEAVELGISGRKEEN